MDDPADQVVPPSRRKTRLARPHKSGILIPPWWRQNRALAVLALSVFSVIAALIVIGSASDRVGHVPNAAEKADDVRQQPKIETLDEIAALYQEEPLPGDVYEEAPVIAPPDPAAGILHPIEDPGAVYDAEPIGKLIESLDKPGPEPDREAAAPELPADTLAAPDPAQPSTARPRKPDKTETASLGRQTDPETAAGDPLPAWLRFALPFKAQPGKPMIAVVIDDVGVSRRYSADSIALPGPLTMSFMTYASDVNEQADTARARGHEIMLHVPMEPGSTSVDPGPNVLLAGMPEPELRANLTWAMSQLDGYVGINNHMGSRFTQDHEGMRTVLETISRSGHLFIDSRTSGGSVASELAAEIGLPFASRNVFLDHEDDPESIRRQLAQTERLAVKNGAVIAIGHPRPATNEALREWLPTLTEKGFQLAPVSAIVREKWLKPMGIAKTGELKAGG